MARAMGASHRPDSGVVSVAERAGTRSAAQCGWRAKQRSCALGPNPAAISWLKGQHCWHLLIKAPSRGAAQGLLDKLGPLKRHNAVATVIDVDPVTTG